MLQLRSPLNLALLCVLLVLLIMYLVSCFAYARQELINIGTGWENKNYTQAFYKSIPPKVVWPAGFSMDYNFHQKAQGLAPAYL